MAGGKIIYVGVGFAVDVDTEREYDVVKARFHEWSEAQRTRVRALSAEAAREQGAPGAAGATEKAE